MSLTLVEIEKNMSDCLVAIGDALSAAGREGEEIALVGAVKTQPKEIIDATVSRGLLKHIGDNRVQEMLSNYNPDLNVTRHFIGRLQTNKVKYVIDKVDLIHSLDRDELAKEIDKQASKRGIVADCLIEVNVGSELSKGGVEMSDVIAFALSMDAYPNIRVKGLMSVMPKGIDKSDLIDLYKRFYDVYNDLRARNSNIGILSCGMSDDYQIAVQYGGSNMVRLGRTIFGERDYTVKQ
ncbi:MAG: YggS family pyridoxal phosphate-dependent enzyme [Clostridia bacterium]|nr:YggS family pyridoxal phosphate-dependent enzyme [Clostridia bacterium]